MAMVWNTRKLSDLHVSSVELKPFLFVCQDHQLSFSSAKGNRGMAGFLNGVCQVTTPFSLPPPLRFNSRESPCLL